MPASVENQRRESPEQLVNRVLHSLRNHVLWDALLTVCPLLVGAIYISVSLYRTALLDMPGVVLILLAASAGSLSAMFLRFRPLVPSRHAAARLVDEKAQAKDRFMTLATLDATPSSELLLNRLRRETTAFIGRIEVRRDFPYQIKHSFYWSLAVSVLTLLLFHIFLGEFFTTPTVSPQKRLRELAEQMARRPPLSELGRHLQSLTAKLEDPALSPQDKQTLVQETRREVEQQQKNERQTDNKDLLSDASSTLKSLEQQSGGSQQQEQTNKGDGKQAEEGQGEGKQSSADGGDSKGDLRAQANKDLQEGKSAQGNPQGQGQEKDPGHDQTKGNQPEASKSGQEKGKEATAQPQGSAQEKLGKSKSEEIPPNGPPAERFYKPGEEGQQGIKDGRYVTVQLPEELAGDGTGVGMTSKDAKESRNRPKVPVSNVPLPAHVPDAPSEKQPMPLEYRDLIR